MPVPATSFMRARPSRFMRRGFSLVELLLSIFILAIGVIAISAIFPAGIIQQQQSADDVIGPIVAQNALGVLRSKLSQEDFGTFEQFGIYLDDQLTSEIPVATPSPGDWTWMRPSYLLRGGIFQPATPNLDPDSLHGAIDIFGLRRTRREEGFPDLPEYSGESNVGEPGNANGIFATSDLAVLTNFEGTLSIPGEDLVDSAEQYRYGRFFGLGNECPESLHGIPYNRKKHAILRNYAPTNGFEQDYVVDPERFGTNEPLVTILQSERTWPQGAKDPQYVWDCLFRRYQGRIQVAIFVYRVSAASGEPRPYAVASGIDATISTPTQGYTESPLPVRLVLDGEPGDDPWEDTYWTPRGLDKDDAANKFDDDVVPGTYGTDGNLNSLDAYGEGWQYPGQWLLDQNGNIHKVLSGRRMVTDGPVRLARPVPHVARHTSNGNTSGPDGPSTIDEASAVKAIWFIPPESRDGMILTPVFVTVRDL